MVLNRHIPMVWQGFIVIVLLVVGLSLAEAGRFSTSRVSNGNASTLTDRPSGDLEQDLERYVRSNYSGIKENAARGQGEHLVVLSALLNIAVKDRQAFYQAMQAQWPEVLANKKQAPDALRKLAAGIRKQQAAEQQMTESQTEKPAASEPAQSEQETP